MKNYQTVTQLKERTGYCRATIMKYFDVPGVSYRLGRAIRFDADAVDRIIEELANTKVGKENANNG